MTLTLKQCVALSGEVYAAFKVLEDNPGSAEMWAHVRTANADALDDLPVWNPLTIGDRVLDPHELRFGPFVDVTLAKHHLRITSASRATLLEHVARALQEAATLMERRAGGDYSPDTNAERFPKVELPAPSVATPKAAPKGDAVVTLTELLNHKEQTQSQKARTYDAYRSRVRDFAKFIGHEDARRVTRENIRDWRTNLQERGLSTKTINDGYLTSVKAALSHGEEEFSIPNVAARIRDKRDAPGRVAARTTPTNRRCASCAQHLGARRRTCPFPIDVRCSGLRG